MRRGRELCGQKLSRAVLITLCLGLVGCEPVDRPSRTDLPREPLEHRESVAACTAPSRAEPVLGPAVTRLGCTKNADCTDGRSGRCVVSGSATSCVYDACERSADCPGVAVCECGAANVCVANGCRIDADCGGGGYCSPSGCASDEAIPHYCHTTDDQCFDDADCKGIDVCRYQASTRTWRCRTVTCQ